MWKRNITIPGLLVACACLVLPRQSLAQAQPTQRDLSTPDQAKVGTVAADAIAIETDQLTPFNMGAAAVRKGNAVGLIDPKGSFIVPYNKYTGIASSPASLNGLFEVRLANGGSGIINSQGKLLQTATKLQHIEVDPYPGGFAWIETNPERMVVNGWIVENYICVNSQGERAVLKHWLRSSGDQWSEGLLRFKTHEPTKYGFIDLTGKVVISPKYVDARQFTEGLAAVAILDEFKEKKWGFIDKQGKTVIPFQYSNPPSLFSQGFAIVIPKITTDIQFSIIDKSGKIVASIPASAPISVNTASKGLSSGFSDLNLFFSGMFANGIMLLQNNTAVGINGEIIEKKHLFALGGKRILDNERDYELLPGPSPSDYRFTYRARYGGEDRLEGLLDFANRRAIEPVFETLSVFDPVSNLAYAKMKIGKDEKGQKNIYREGYINREGVYVIVKKENASIW